MINFDDLEDDDDDNDEFDDFDVNQFKANISSYSSKKLCEMIVCHRYLGFAQEAAVASMEELGKRRLAGDSFDFESFIENSMKELPALNFTGIPDLSTVLNQAIGKKIGNR
jgi:hypothetical protein